MSSVPQFILQLGQCPMFLGPGRTSRVSDSTKAVRFTNRHAADQRAALLRGNGPLPIPWRVVPVAGGGER